MPPVIVGVRCPRCARLHADLAAIQREVRAADGLDVATLQRIAMTYAAWCERQQAHIGEHTRN